MSKNTATAVLLNDLSDSEDEFVACAALGYSLLDAAVLADKSRQPSDPELKLSRMHELAQIGIANLKRMADATSSIGSARRALSIDAVDDAVAGLPTVAPTVAAPVAPPVIAAPPAVRPPVAPPVAAGGNVIQFKPRK